jgi:hypothetical protein
MTAMKSWLILLVAVYVSLDVANPMMPGALTFGIADSVESRQAERFRGHDDGALFPASPAPERLEPADRGRTLARGPSPAVARPWQADTPRRRPSTPAPAAPSEDH